MKCEICEKENASNVKFDVMEFKLCGWCTDRIHQYIKGNINHSIINICWGFGKVGHSAAWSFRNCLRKYGIKEVLEFGSGLSTELMVNEGTNVISCDVLENHSKLYSKLDSLQNSNQAKFIWYPDSKHLPDFDKLYPGRKWDFVFVDGPQERSNEVRLAMKLSNKWIYLDDPNLGEQSFFPNEEWKLVEGYDRFYQKVEKK